MKPELCVVLIAGIFLSVVQYSYYLYDPNAKQYVPLIFYVLIGYLGYIGLGGGIKEIGGNSLEGFILLSVFSGIPITFTVIFLRTFVQFHDDDITYSKFGDVKSLCLGRISSNLSGEKMTGVIYSCTLKMNQVVARNL